MQFLVLTRRLTETFADARFDEFQDAEVAHVRKLYAQGLVRAVHARGDLKGAVLVVEAADAEEASATAHSLPFAVRKMLEVQVVPLLPYRGFAT